MALSRIKLFELGLEREFALDCVETILRESPPALRAKLDWMRGYFEDEWRHSIVGRYQVATLIREIYDDVTERGGAVYGAQAVEAIQKAFHWDDSVIYQALHVADAFTPEQIEAITRMRLPGGGPLSYSHVAVLSRVEDPRQREKLLKQAVKEGWTTRRLSNAVGEIAAPEPSQPTERRGRPLARPRDFDAVLDQQASCAREFSDRNDRVWSDPAHSLSAKLEDLDPAGFTQERADRLKRHAEDLAALAEKAQKRAEEARQIHELFLRALKERAAKHKAVGSSAAPDGKDGPRNGYASDGTGCVKRSRLARR
jgi:hypothetical protein